MKALTLVPIGGLANRMLAVTSAISFCMENQMRLKIVWFKDWGMGADFHSLFELLPAVENVDVVDAKIWDYRFDRPRKRNLWLPFFWQRMAFDKRIYEKEMYAGFQRTELETAMQTSRSIYLVHCYWIQDTPEMLNLIRPKAHIREKIEEKTAFFGKKTIGLHIRRGDHSISKANSPLSLFISKIEEELAIDKQAKFYVASDSREEKIKLIDLFGDSIITSLEETRRDTEDGIIDALVEMYVLSLTKKIYGSLASTFSEAAAKISSIPLEILSV